MMTNKIFRSLVIILLGLWGCGCWVVVALPHVLEHLGTSWLLRPFAFPWPALIGCPISLLLLLWYYRPVITIHVARPMYIRKQENQGYIESEVQNINHHVVRRHTHYIEHTTEQLDTVFLPRYQFFRLPDMRIQNFLLSCVMLIFLGGGLLLTPICWGYLRYTTLPAPLPAGMRVLFIINVGIPVGLIGLTAFAVLGYAIAGGERIELHFFKEQVCLWKELVLVTPFFLRVSFQQTTSPMSRVGIEQHDLTGWQKLNYHGESRLLLNMNGKPHWIAAGYSRNEHQQLMTFLKARLAPIEQYKFVHTVIFGNDSGSGRSQRYTLRNPDVSHLTVSMPVLKTIKIHTQTYNFYQLERFITYVINYLGQEYLKQKVGVEIYGEAEQLHPNLKNLLTQVCKSIVFHQGENDLECHESAKPPAKIYFSA